MLIKKSKKKYNTNLMAELHYSSILELQEHGTQALHPHCGAAAQQHFPLCIFKTPV